MLHTPYMYIKSYTRFHIPFGRQENTVGEEVFKAAAAAAGVESSDDEDDG